MSDFSEDIIQQTQKAFIDKWAPEGSFETVEVTQENLRFNIAGKRAAEAELLEVKKALGILLRAVN